MDRYIRAVLAVIVTICAVGLFMALILLGSIAFGMGC